MDRSTPSFVVVGAGLAGGLMATLLGQSGRPVIGLERRPDPRTTELVGGRSINLALSERGLHALEHVGLKESILRLSVPLYGRMIHSPSGRLAFQPYGTRGRSIYSLSRAGLNAALLDAAEQAGATLRFGRRCTGLDLAQGQVVCRLPDDREERVSGIIIGTDGAYSAVRGEMLRREQQDFSQQYLSHGYRELHIPPAPDGTPRLDPEALHIWPRGGFMMMAMANVDGSFTVTLYLALEGRDSFAALQDPESVGRFFDRNFADAIPHLPGLEQAWSRHPTGTLVTIRTRPWSIDGKVTLAGDACHAIVPFFGQGANAAFEDCLSLRNALERYPEDPARAFSAYEAERAPNADAIADLAIANFHEMRDHVASPLFRLEKRGEVLLHRLLPHWFIPLYTMISFTRIPYAEASARARRQTRLLRVAGMLLLGLLVAAGYLLVRPGQ